MGPQNDDGIRMYYDGVEVANDTDWHGSSRLPGDSRIVLGRYKTNDNNNYPSVHVDELMFFDRTLSPFQIQKLYNSV